MKKKSIVYKYANFFYLLCTLFVQHPTNVSAMELPKMSDSCQQVLGNADILSCIIPYVLSNDSKDMYRFCTVNKKLNRKWKSRKFIKKLLIHPEYLVNERINSRRYLQCALMNENYISRLSKSISIEFVEYSKKRIDDDDRHEVDLTSSLGPYEILNILYKLYKTKEMFRQNKLPENKLPVFPTNVLWLDWCAEGIFLAYKQPSPYPPLEVRKKFASILGLSLTSNDWNAYDTQREKWIQDLSSMRLEHPNAALMYAFFGSGFSATFWCKMPSKINNRTNEIRMYITLFKQPYFRDTEGYVKHKLEIKDCYAFAIKSGIKGAVEMYLSASNIPYEEEFKGLDISLLQEQYFNSLLANPNSQDEKK